MHSKGMARETAGSSSTHLQALREKHATLSDFIKREEQSPSNPDYYLRQLKKEKLSIKDQIQDVQDRIQRMKDSAAN